MGPLSNERHESLLILPYRKGPETVTQKSRSKREADQAGRTPELGGDGPIAADQVEGPAISFQRQVGQQREILTFRIRRLNRLPWKFDDESGPPEVSGIGLDE